MSDITVITKQEYLASPCSALPLPYMVCGGKASVAERIGGEGISIMSVPEGAFSRMIFRLGDMERFESKEHSVRRLFIADDADDASLIASLASACGAELNIASFIKKPYYNEKLCAAVHEKATGECVCAGLGGIDTELKEAWFEALLIPDGHIGGSASRLLINELLRRMAPMAEFVTANAPCGSNLERLLRKCGFTGGDIWRFNGNLRTLRI